MNTINAKFPKKSFNESIMEYNDEKIILLGHGSGGELTHQLIQNIFRKFLTDTSLDESHDSVSINLNLGSEYTAIMSTDSFVVKPLFFSGGDIGKLSVIGTINDIAMSGAEPIYLSVAFIIEEGFKITDLEKIVKSIADEATKNNVRVVCGDTKVVERGHGDGLYINTTGIGRVLQSKKILPKNIEPGDFIYVSGDVGRHGMAIMSEREHLDFKSQIISDCQSLWPLIYELQQNKIELHCLRDLSRGGLMTSLVELAETSECNMQIIEDQIPISEPVRSACEILGLDPLYVANEGTCTVIVPESQVLQIKKNQAFLNLKLIGRVLDKVKEKEKAKVFLKTLYGVERRMFRLMGDQLPRIC